jgi:hypothetical protein
LDAKDSADANLDLTITAQGTGKIRLGSILALSDEVFLVPNSVDETKVAKFSSASIPTGVTHTYILPSNGLENAADTLVTLSASQTLSNKTIADGVFTGTLSVADVTASGNVTLGSDAADTVTMNGVTSFSAGATFNNTLVINQGATISGDITANDNIDMSDDKYVKLGTDDDLQLGYVSAQDFSYISNSASQLIVDSNGITLQSVGGNKYFKGDISNTDIYHGGSGSARISTTATGIEIKNGASTPGPIEMVTDITSSGNIVSTGTDHSLGASSAAKLGVGRTAATYNLEVEGSIFATGSSLILGDTSSSKAIIQKRTVGLGLHFADESGVDQAVLDGNGNFGIGKNPSYRLDVSGNSWIDGDITINTTDPVAKVGGNITAREILLIDPQTGASTTLDATSAGGVSRAKVYFHSFN